MRVRFEATKDEVQVELAGELEVFPVTDTSLFSLIEDDGSHGGGAPLLDVLAVFFSEGRAFAPLPRDQRGLPAWSMRLLPARRGAALVLLTDVPVRVRQVA